MSSVPLNSAPDLVVRSAPIADPGSLIGLLPAGLPADEIFSWVRGGDGIIGWGRTAAMRSRGPARMAEADRWWGAVLQRATVQDAVQRPGTGLICFGSFAFADHSPQDSPLIIPQVVVGRAEGQCWVTTIRHRHDVAQPVTIRPAPQAAAPQWLHEEPGHLDEEQWRRAVAKGITRIQSGAMDKIVLARDVVATCAEPIDPRAVLARLSSDYPNTWTFSVDGLIGATPELLVRRTRGLATSRVLAGTIRRSGDDEKDLASAARLARSSKDREEHEYAVRSVVDALTEHCLSMNVPEAPFVLHLPNVMHLATDIAGVLRDGVSSLALAAALHPSAAVCGTPTADAARAITELEEMDRARYAGPVGWCGADGDGEWGIALRSGQIEAADPRRIRLFAGCGIVAGSDPDAELAESQAKLVPMRSAVGTR
ncbi:isochorismate synthase [Dermacoccaceae bacterium W4C1]